MPEVTDPRALAAIAEIAEEAEKARKAAIRLHNDGTAKRGLEFAGEIIRRHFSEPSPTLIERLEALADKWISIANERSKAGFNTLGASYMARADELRQLIRDHKEGKP